MFVRKETSLEWESYARRDVTTIGGIVVHRIEVSQEDPGYSDSVEDTARFFREHEVGVKATGGEMPYPILILPDGEIVQALPLDRITPHARSHNPSSIGVACIGDFRKKPPEEEQYRALVVACASLLQQLKLDVQTLVGHDELVGGSSDPDKECPGRGNSMVHLREEVGGICVNEKLLRFSEVY